MMTTRALTGADVALWRALRLDGIERFPSAFLPSLQEAQAIPEAADIASLDHGNRFAAFAGDVPVGIAGLHPETMPRAKHRAEIGPFYVQPAAQGQGAAAALMQALIEHVRSLGVWQMELTVVQTNARAIAFYEKMGFCARVFCRMSFSGSRAMRMTFSTQKTCADVNGSTA